MKWYITATILVAVGFVMFVAVMSINKWDFTKLSTVEYETNTYELTEDFSNIKIDLDTADIVFEKSEDDKCRVECYEDVNCRHEVKVEDGTLVISVDDQRKWYHNISLSFQGGAKIIVYLPKLEYNKLNINASTGDVRIDCMTFNDMELSVSTGDIVIDSVECVNDIKVKVSTGDVFLTDVTCSNLNSNGSTGDITLKKVIASEKFNINRSTGNVKFEDCDAAEIKVEVSTGSVKGNFLTSKIITAKSSTGDVDVPKNTEGGKCEITTSTGDIKIK